MYLSLKYRDSIWRINCHRGCFSNSEWWSRGGDEGRALERWVSLGSTLGWQEPSSSGASVFLPTCGDNSHPHPLSTHTMTSAGPRSSGQVSESWWPPLTEWTSTLFPVGNHTGTHQDLCQTPSAQPLVCLAVTEHHTLGFNTVTLTFQSPRKGCAKPTRDEDFVSWEWGEDSPRAYSGEGVGLEGLVVPWAKSKPTWRVTRRRINVSYGHGTTGLTDQRTWK